MTMAPSSGIRATSITEIDHDECAPFAFECPDAVRARRLSVRIRRAADLDACAARSGPASAAAATGGPPAGRRVHGPSGRRQPRLHPVVGEACAGPVLPDHRRAARVAPARCRERVPAARPALPSRSRRPGRGASRAGRAGRRERTRDAASSPSHQRVAKRGSSWLDACHAGVAPGGRSDSCAPPRPQAPRPRTARAGRRSSCTAATRRDDVRISFSSSLDVRLAEQQRAAGRTPRDATPAPVHVDRFGQAEVVDGR